MSEAMDVRFPDVDVELTGQDGNIFFIAGRVGNALKRSGADRETINEFYAELETSGNYDAALRVVMSWVSVS